MSGSPELTEENISKFNDLLKGMRYGTITVIVQDGRIIQMDKTEKHRL
ncbi:MAG: YezD family protein [Lachnospiraceae bacterium]|nr:YezD family protein [Lachnospiraceae bacterium]